MKEQGEFIISTADQKQQCSLAIVLLLKQIIESTMER